VIRGSVHHGRRQISQAVSLADSIELQAGQRIPAWSGAAPQIRTHQRPGRSGAGQLEQMDEPGIAVRLGIGGCGFAARGPGLWRAAIAGWLLTLAVITCLLAVFFILITGGTRVLSGHLSRYAALPWRGLSIIALARKGA